MNRSRAFQRARRSGRMRPTGTCQTGGSVMTVADVSAVMLRDIDALRAQVEAYPTDELLWRAIPGLPNSGGTLPVETSMGRTASTLSRLSNFPASGSLI